MSHDRHMRTMLPIPDRSASGLTTYDAKVPATAYSALEPLLPPPGAPHVLVNLLDDVGSRQALLTGRIHHAVGMGSISETGTTVTPDHTPASSRFTGRIHWVQLDVGTDDHDHFIQPEERLRGAMARQ